MLAVGRCPGDSKGKAQRNLRAEWDGRTWCGEYTCSVVRWPALVDMLVNGDTGGFVLRRLRAQRTRPTTIAMRTTAPPTAAPIIAPLLRGREDMGPPVTGVGVPLATVESDVLENSAIEELVNRFGLVALGSVWGESDGRASGALPLLHRMFH
jgi:hypothetical protein